MGFERRNFPCDPGCLGQTFSGHMHNTLAAIGATALAVTPVFMWLAMRKGPQWQTHGGFTLVIQVVGLIVFVLFVLADHVRAQHHRNFGLVLSKDSSMPYITSG